jgi:serine/threonine-protein kinase RsbW
MLISTAHSPGEPAQPELRLPSDVTAPAFARRAVNDILSSVPASVRAQLSLVASELVTNVLRHCTATDPDATLTVAVAPDRITLTVTDAGAGFDPAERPSSDDPSGGWGLVVLDAIADRWWIERDGRTRVICEIDR